MENDLRQRLDALSAEATSGPWDNSGPHSQPADFGVYAPQGRSICSTGGFADGKDITYRQNVANAKFIAAVSNAFRSGDLVTRSELVEAVAEERSNCSHAIDTADIEDLYKQGGRIHFDDLQEFFSDLVYTRARSEQKEGE